MSLDSGKKYDILLYGATGFTGKYILNTLMKVKEDFKLAIGGRNETAIRVIINELRNDYDKTIVDSIGVFIADCHDTDALDRMISNAKIIINAVGPYRLYGESVIVSAIKNGTHYVDICGETHFLEKMQMLYDHEASEKSVYVIGACGWDSLIADLGIMHLKDMHDSTFDYVETFAQINFGEEGYPINYGTYRSLILSLVNIKTDKLGSIRKEIMNQKPPADRSGYKVPKRKQLWYNDDMGRWCIPFLGSDKSVITRSQYFDYVYNGRKPIPVSTYIAIQSWFNAALVLVWFMLLNFLIRFKFLHKFILDSPDLISFNMFSKEGPTTQQIEDASFTYWFNGQLSKTDDVPAEHDRRIIRVDGPDPGYRCTSACVVQAAIMILNNIRDMPKSGGVMTPAYALRDTPIIRALSDNGISFKDLSR